VASPAGTPHQTDLARFYNFWRPETAIHRANDDGNRWTSGGPIFQPVIAAPGFPSDGSAHAAASHAARQVAEAFVGQRI
jgi:hypothetical protein